MNFVKTAYAVWTNTNLTGGRGTEYIKTICEKQATAIRIAKKGYIMGDNCPISKVEIFAKEHTLYGPVHIIAPTIEDLQIEEQLVKVAKAASAKQAAIEKAKLLGLSEDDINALKG